MIKKILNKLFGIKFGPIEWIGPFPEPPKFPFSEIDKHIDHKWPTQSSNNTDENSTKKNRKKKPSIILNFFIQIGRTNISKNYMMH